MRYPVPGSDPEIVLVTGGREYDNHRHVYATLDRIGPSLIIEGGATGADRLARYWAEDRGVPYATVNAHWRKYGKSAGPLRNGWMLLLRPDAVVAFPGGRGTADMVRKATVAGVPVIHAETPEKAAPVER